MRKRDSLRACALFIAVGATVFSCKSAKTKEIELIVQEWSGKAIKYVPEIPCISLNKDAPCPDLSSKLYKVLAYTDSIGCVYCKLRMYEWKRLIVESDSLMPNELGFEFYFYPQNEKELNTLLMRDAFKYPVHVDKNDDLNKVNQFPLDERYRCFLLDKDNRVLLVGNPTLNPKIWELYKEVITGKKAAPQERQTVVEMEKNEHEFGEIKTGESSIAVFQLKNTGEHPLIISRVATSCGCASADWERQPVAAGQTTTVTVEMKPEEAGFFSKTAEVHCNAKGSPIRLTVSGTASKQQV